MGWLYKKSEAATTLLIIIVILFFLGWLVNIGQRECKSNRDCGSESYCGSDFSCHSYPTIQKTVVQYSLFWPAVIIAIAIVAATIIFRWDKIRREKIVVEHKPEAKTSYQEPEAAEPYYKSDTYYKSTTNSKTP
ncbi:hypothetical protein HYX04_00630 [Candidatus Woesearchaeota archaeon]|nr:hypothetical protein [Candidatus Woesearchaeota archaeon]